MKINGALEVPDEALKALCERHRIRRLAVFGSALRDELRPDSDIDVLVQFEEGCTPGFGFVRIQDELSDLLGRRVDLNTAQSLSPRIREQVTRTARDVYDGT